MEGRDLLFKLSNSFGVSGYEYNLHNILEEYFRRYSDEILKGNLGEFIAVKKGYGGGDLKVMIAAHADEIGLIVNEIDDKGLVHFTGVTNIDPRTIAAQEVVIQGKKAVYGVVGVKPPHVMTEEDRKKAPGIEEMIIDTGMAREELSGVVSIGDMITVKRECMSLLSDFITGKALDDRSGVCAMFECARELDTIEHEADIYFTATVMEEIDRVGAGASAYGINPCFCITVDVTFADKYADDDIEGVCGKGIEIAVGPNLHPYLTEKLVETSDENCIPYYIEAYPRDTGTDAWNIQTVRQGIPTALISIPLRYMHSSTEVISYRDVEDAGRLMALFISKLKGWRGDYDA